MDLVRSFLASRSGSALEKFAFGAVLVMLASLASASLLTRIASNGAHSAMARQQTQPDPRYVELGSLGPAVKSGPNFNNIDSTPTGTVALSTGHTIVLDPCTGKSK